MAKDFKLNDMFDNKPKHEKEFDNKEVIKKRQRTPKDDSKRLKNKIMMSLTDSELEVFQQAVEESGICDNSKFLRFILKKQGVLK